MFMRDSKIIVKAFCINANEKELAYYFPQESAQYWYPLYPYYNYYYLPNYNDIMLVVDINAPDPIKTKINKEHIHLNDLDELS